MSQKKLTDKQIKKIISERAEGASYASIAKKFKISPNTAKNYCLKDPEFAEICTQKKEENTKSILSHMETKANLVCDIIDGYLSELANPDRIETSSTREIAIALGVILDKFSKTDKGEDMSKLDDVLKKIGGKI